MIMLTAQTMDVLLFVFGCILLLLQTGGGQCLTLHLGHQTTSQHYVNTQEEKTICSSSMLHKLRM